MQDFVMCLIWAFTPRLHVNFIYLLYASKLRPQENVHFRVASKSQRQLTNSNSKDIALMANVLELLDELDCIFPGL